MKVLVACECSGTVRNAFRSRGHDAWSCDVQPADDDSEYHIQGDVRDWLAGGVEHFDSWDLIIAHPPCTFISRAGARHMYPQAGVLNADRYEQGLDAVQFFYDCLNAPAKYIAVENPTPLKVFALPEPDCVIQPYQFGHPYSKRTLLWLRNLPALQPTQLIEDYKPYLPSNTGGRSRNQKAQSNGAMNKDRSKTFAGIAEAMADQWGDYVSRRIAA